jgi:EAL domain-containing protein (putative c-di-GMP-specific phosphodiesterase class I)
MSSTLTPSSPLHALLSLGGITSLYQPIVDIDSGSVVAYEALARGPLGSAMAFPDLMFAEARRLHLLAELDLACRVAALSGAQMAGLGAPWTLFVNTEPETAQTTLVPPLGDPVPVADRDDVHVVIELTERALTSDPVQLLRLVDRIRARGWGIALDDVGTDRGSLALLPLLRPDVIKLDLRLIQDRPTAQIAEIVGAVNAEAERAGTTVLAEGIETAEHVMTARALGATLGQGWFFGRPGPLPPEPATFDGPRLRLSPRAARDSLGTPFELAAPAGRTPQTAAKPLLIELSKHLERQALSAGETAVIVSTFQHASMFTPATQRRYRELADSAAFVGVLGKDIQAEPLPGVRGGQLAPGDPLLDEWDVAVIGPHYAATLIARDMGGDINDPHRRFEFLLSHSRDLVVAVAGCLMDRITAV